MKIGFDAKRAVQNNTGLENHSRFDWEKSAKEYLNVYGYMLKI
jgi:glycogen synthase